MNLTWHGFNCVRLQGKEATVMMDPFSEKEGIKLSKLQSDIVTLSNDALDPNRAGGDPFIVEIPGEYEIKGTFVYGMQWRKEKSEGNTVLFRVNMEGVSFGHLGGLDRVIPNNALAVLEGVDVLMLPVGDPDLLSAKDAVEVIARIEPRIVIPMSLPVKGAKKKLVAPDAFYKELGVKPQTMDKAKITLKDLPQDERVVYQLELS